LNLNLGHILFDSQGVEKEAGKELEGKLVGLFFSAQWCPSCRQFTPLLKQFYELLKRDGEKFEIVFISRDLTLKVIFFFFF